MTKEQPKPSKIPLRFYKSAAGSEPVRDWLKKLTGEERRAIGKDLAIAQFAWPVGMPLCRPLGRGLFEVRTSMPDRIARVFICLADKELVALHAIIKKTKALRADDLVLARRRMREVLKK